MSVWVLLSGEKNPRRFVYGEEQARELVDLGPRNIYFFRDETNDELISGVGLMDERNRELTNECR